MRETLWGRAYNGLCSRTVEQRCVTSGREIRHLEHSWDRPRNEKKKSEAVQRERGTNLTEHRTWTLAGILPFSSANQPARLGQESGQDNVDQTHAEGQRSYREHEKGFGKYTNASGN